MAELVAFLRTNRLAALGCVLLAAIVLCVVAGPLVYEASPTRLNILRRLAPPGADFWLGTDSLGRDVLARVLHGGRVTLVVGCGVVAIAFVAGATIGMVSGFAGGWVDAVVMRLADAMLSFPSLVLAIALAAAFGPSLENAMLAVAITLMPQFARVARAQAVSVSARPYVEAAVTLGLPRSRILLRYVFANGVGPLFVQATLALGAAILQTASLGFLGLGAQPPAAEWGADVSINLDFVRSAPWVALAPGAGILLAVMAFNLIGDGLAEWLDPRRRPAD
ncbi:MAG: ABC transporter permease [Alphaproteobacteria bacterium]|jgi:peptide/nickel transport system permease protein